MAGPGGDQQTLPDSHPAQLQEYLTFVRKNCPYFQDLWEHVPEGSPLSAYPSMDSVSYWAVAAADDARVLTGEHADGIVYRTGGSTTQPKLAYSSHEEATAGDKELADCFVASGVRRADRVANLLFAGEFYGGFLGVAAALASTPLAVHLPIEGHVDTAIILQSLRQHRATVVVAYAGQLYDLALKIESNDEPPLEQVRLLLYGGESLYQSYITQISKAFPNAVAKSFAYGATEFGLVGFGAGQADRAVHVVKDQSMICEIVDESDNVITEPGIEGRLLVTSLQKKLMPLVRYPIGDSASWVDLDKRTFKLLGRVGVVARLARFSIDLYIIRNAVQKAIRLSESSPLQVIMERHDNRDRLRLRFVDLELDPVVAAAAIEHELGTELNLYRDHLVSEQIRPLVVETCPHDKFVRAKRTGKVLEVVDTRGV